MEKRLVVSIVSALAVAGSAMAEFTCKIDVPVGDIGKSRTAIITCWNNDSEALPAPFVRVEAGEGAYVRFSETDAWSKSVEFFATSEQVPGDGLCAGETIKQPIFVRTDSDEANLTLSWLIESGEDFPWSDIGASLKPSYVTEAAWTFALATLRERLGMTWNDYLDQLCGDAWELAQQGRPVRRVDRLLQIEVNKALGVDSVLPVLASVTDAARSARGLGLSFTRSYSSAMYGRFNKGILGYGWTDNLSTYAELSSDKNTLVFRTPGGGSYSFTKATGSWQPEDARDKTVLTESASAYTLTYQNGTVQTFAKSNMRTESIADNVDNKLTFMWNGATLRQIAHTDGQSLSFAYSGGLLSSVTDDCGRKTQYAYSDSLLTKVTASDGLVTSYEYRSADDTAAARALSRIIYPDGTTREFSYDTSSGLVSAISVNGGKEKISIARDELNIVLKGPDGSVTTLAMGESGEVLETVDALGGISTKGYTDDGLLKSVVSPSGLKGSIEHDALGRVSKSVSAAGTSTAFTYDETFGNLKTVTDAKKHAVTYGYDSKGRGTSVTFADGSASTIEYDNSSGDVKKSTNRRGQSIVFEYDPWGRVTKKTWSTGRTFAYEYDDHDNVTKAVDSETGAVLMQYDSADRLKRIEYPKGRGFTFTYDTKGRLSTRTSLDGSSERFAYDASGRLASVSDGNGTAYLRNTYDTTTGRLTKQVNGNGTSVSYLYDKLGRVVSIEHCGADGKIAESLQYCYDADGRCIRAASLLGEERYVYDKDGQLTVVEYPDGRNELFTYDAVGNRTTANGKTYTVNSLNQYTEISDGTSLAYDKDGNLTKVTGGNGTTLYYYDMLNRLVAVTNTTTGIRWSCQYDVFGNRVSVTDNGVTTERIYLQGALPSVAAEYVNGELAERHIVVGAVKLATLSTHNSQPSTQYYHADLIGSTRLVTDANGTVVDRRAYKAFGETRVGEDTDSSAGYVGTLGVETDPTGLLFMRNRYYSPTLGRFMQEDPIGMKGGTANLYKYAANSPINFVDPAGLDWFGAVKAGVQGFCKGVAIAAVGIAAVAAVVATAGVIAIGAGTVAVGASGALVASSTATVGMGAAVIGGYVTAGMIGVAATAGSVSSIVGLGLETERAVVTGENIEFTESVVADMVGTIAPVNDAVAVGMDMFVPESVYAPIADAIQKVMPNGNTISVDIDSGDSDDGGGSGEGGGSSEGGGGSGEGGGSGGGPGGGGSGEGGGDNPDPDPGTDPEQGDGLIMNLTDWMNAVISKSGTYSLGADIVIELDRKDSSGDDDVVVYILKTGKVVGYTDEGYEYHYYEDGVHLKGKTSIRAPLDFSGTLNGNGHKITVKGTTPVGDWMFLFMGAKGATFENVVFEGAGIRDAENCTFRNCSSLSFPIVREATGCKFENCGGVANINKPGYHKPDDGDFCLGAIASQAERCEFNECNVSGMVGGDDHTGGIVGLAIDCKFSRCQSSAAVTGDEQVGGLVGYATSCEFNDCKATGAVGGRSLVGGFVGYSCEYLSYGAGSKFANCTASGDVSGMDGGGFAGAFLKGSSVSHCSASGKVVASSSDPSDPIGDLGGFAGEINEECEVSDCVATGAVVANAATGVGGFVGSGSGSTDNPNGTIIQRCCARGAVTGGTNVGGFAGGLLYCTILDCCATGTATAKGVTTSAGGISTTAAAVGGFAAIASSTTGVTLRHCYASGKVTTIASDVMHNVMATAGGLTPFNIPLEMLAYIPADQLEAFLEASEACYWNKTTTGQNYSGTGTGLTAAQMTLTSSYSGWDFNNVWKMGSSGPELRNVGATTMSANYVKAPCAALVDKTSTKEVLPSDLPAAERGSAAMPANEVAEKPHARFEKTTADVQVAANIVQPMSRIYSYERYVVVKGSAYVFDLTADGGAEISVSGLPDGFSFMGGVIYGSASAVGETTMTVSAASATRQVPFVVVEAPEAFSSNTNMTLSDLRPYTPSGWSAPVVVAKSSSSTMDDADISVDDELFLSWAVICMGKSVPTKFYIKLYVDGVEKKQWVHSGTLPLGYRTYVKAFNIGKLSAGTHTVKVVVDSAGAVAESDRGNNTYTKTIVVSNGKYAITYLLKLHRNNSANDGATAGRALTVDVERALPKIESELKWAPRAGYTFLGWATSANATSAKYTDGQGVKNLSTTQDATVHLYAVWKANSYLLRLHRNNSATDTATAGRALTYNKERALPKVESELKWAPRSGYTFLGWATSASATSAKYTDGQSVKNLSTSQDATVHLYAVWKKNDPTPQFTFGGDAVWTKQSDGSWKSGKVGDYGSTCASMMVTGPGTISFKWKTSSESNYDKLHFYVNGAEPVAAISGIMDSWASVSYNVTASGSVTLKWEYQKDVSVYAGSDCGWIKDVTWTPKAQPAQTYIVRLHRNNSERDGATAGRTYTIGKARSLPKIQKELKWAPRKGYDFLGWAKTADATTAQYTDGQSLKDLTKTAGATVHLYGVWKAHKYIVRLHRNNSKNDGATTGRAFDYDQVRFLPTMAEIKWARSGYMFLGWSLAQSSTTVKYADGLNVFNLSANDGEELHLWGVWKKADANAYLLRLHRNNSERDGATAGRQLKLNTNRKLPTVKELNWTRTDATFKGWATTARNAAAGKVAYKDGATVKNLVKTAGDTAHLYAVWQ